MSTAISDKIVLPLAGPMDRRAYEDLRRELSDIGGLEDLEVDADRGEIRFKTESSKPLNGQLNQLVDKIGKVGFIVKMASDQIDIFNMRCAGCVKSLEDGLRKKTGIVNVEINFAAQTGRVDYVEGLYDRNLLLKDIKDIGYEADFHREDGENGNSDRSGRKSLALILATAGLVILIHITVNLFGWPSFSRTTLAIIQFILTLPIIYGGREIFIDAARQLIHRRANMNSLVALGSGSAFIYSMVSLIAALFFNKTGVSFNFETTAMIIAFIMIGRFMESRATREARDAALAMSSLIPQTVTRLLDSGQEEEIPIENVSIGDILIVHPGDSIPCDGEIIEGTTTIDESLITGESVPVEKKAAENVIGGTVNSGNGIKMRVTRVGQGTVLSRIIRLVREAQTKKAPIQRLADKVAGIFVPIVIIIALISLAAWAIFDPSSKFVLLAPVAVLLVACPCALGLATPTAVLVGTGRAARLGVLIREASVVESMSRVNCFIFDKTGTLTKGKPEVEEITPEKGTSADKLLQMAATAEKYSEHPFGRAIINRARLQEIDLPEASDYQYQPGKGVLATINNHKVVVGRRSLLIDMGLNEEQVQELKSVEKKDGTTAVYVSIDDRYAGSIVMGDTVKEEASEVVNRLKKEGLHIIMLTGDNYYSAGAVAGKLGIKHIEAEMTPDKKLTTINSLRRAGYITAMVGDGVNDAAALAATDVGIALGSGTDIAMKASDITVSGTALSGVLIARDLSMTTMRIIKQNLFWAFIYNIAMIPIASGLLYPIFGLTMSPILAAAAMSLSSLFVVSNSLRLKNYNLSIKS